MQLTNKHINILIVFPVAIICLSIAVFIITNNELIFAYSFGSSLLIVTLFPWWKKNAGNDIFEPIKLFSIYFGLTIPFKGLLNLMVKGHFLEPFDTSSDFFLFLSLKIFVYAMMGLIFLYLGYYSNRGKRISASLPQLSDSGWRKKQIVFLSIFASFIIGICGLMLYSKSLGGLSVIISSQSYLAVEGTKGKFFYIPIIYFILTGYCLLYLKNINTKWSMTNNLIFASYTFIILAVFFVRSSKGWLLRCIFYILIIRHYFKKPLKTSTFIFIFCIFFSFAPIFMTSYRSFGLDIDNTTSYIENFDSLEKMISYLFGRFYGADIFGIILTKVPSVIDYQYGATLLELFFWFIPRKWWPEKPLGYGLIFGSEFVPDSPLSGLSFITPSLIGELYLNFGGLGIAIGFYLMGILLRTCYEYFIVSNQTKNSMLIYPVILFNLILLVEGPIAGHISLLLSEVFPFAIMGIGILGRLRRS